MLETEMQQMIVDAVQEDGGFSRKLSNRFMVGVVDLIVKMPGHPAAVLEAKRHDYGTRDPSEWQLEVTGPQKRFLRDAHRAGMLSGVVSFVQQRNKGVKSLRMAIYTFTEAEARAYMAQVGDHSDLGDHVERYSNIRGALVSWLKHAQKQ